jgi:aryl-alcohol dehydrogenase-like predicted oxidoreductase
MPTPSSVRRGRALPESSRPHETAGFAPPVADEHGYRVVEAMDEVTAETGKTLPQIAINWLLGQPTAASKVTPPCPYYTYRNGHFAERSPVPV